MSVRVGERCEVRGFGGRSYQGVVARIDGATAHVLRDGKTKTKAVALGNVRALERRAPAPAELTRKPTTEAPALKPVPRPAPPARNATYLKWVRRFRCAACKRAGRSVEAHHASPERGRGMGQKVSDYFVVPLCGPCHKHFHDTGHLPELDVRTTHELFTRAEALLLERWARRGMIDVSHDAVFGRGS